MANLQQQIAFIGAGMMAEAIIRGLLREGLSHADELTASDPLAARRDYLSGELGIHTTASNAEAVSGAQILVLAVKPQMFDRALAEFAGKLDPQILVLSIVAGVKIERIHRALGSQAIVRIMPNTPGQIGEGISVWTATDGTTDSQRGLAGTIVGALGQEIYVDEEDHLDMATALSGSGPAYVFLFIEALIDAGVHMGFSRAVAEKLALQTVRGSAVYAQERALHPAILRNMVTSPGGTTAAALYQFEKGGFRALVARAVWAAYQQAMYLGEEEDE